MSAVEVHRVVKKAHRSDEPGGNAPPRLLVRPLQAPDEPIDLTEALTRAIAGELWRHHQGNDVLNWLEAERVMADLIGRLRSSDPSPALKLSDGAIEAKPAARPARSKLLAAA